jgi:hypothetical protein
MLTVVPREIGTLFDIEITELEQGKPVSIEGILPGNTKSEMLRLTQESANPPSPEESGNPQLIV